MKAWAIYNESVESGFRVIENAKPDQRERAFENAAPDIFKYGQAAGMEEGNIIDRLDEVGIFFAWPPDDRRRRIAEAMAKSNDVPKANGHTEPAAWPAIITAPLTVAEWLARDLPEPDYLCGAWLSTTSRAMLIAATGLGKTNFAIALAMWMSVARKFLHWKGHRPARVLYIDGEMSRRLLKKRIADAARRLGEIPANFFALSHEDIEGFAPLNTSAGQACIDAVIRKIGGVDFIIFDSVMCLTLGDMKDELSWQQTLPWARSLTRRSIGQMWIHHTGHDKTHGYGTKTREWQLDTVMLLEAIAREDTDVSFSLTFTKARERTPETRADFQTVRVALVDDHWTYDLADTVRSHKITPQASKFLAALNDALVDATGSVRGRKAATSDAWKAECVRLGLLDPAKPDSLRSVFSRNRLELVAADRIACQNDLTWTL